MKRFFLMITVLLATTIFLTGCLPNSKSDGIDVLNSFMEINNKIDDRGDILLDEANTSNIKEKIETVKELIKETEDLEKDIMVAKENSSKKIKKRDVEIFNKACDFFANSLKDQVLLLEVFKNMWEDGREAEDLTVEEATKILDIADNIEKKSRLYETTVKGLER